MINVGKLEEELRIAGIEFSGCNSNGVVWDVDGNEIQDRADVAQVIAVHDPTPDPEPDFVQFDKPIKAPDFIVASPKPKDKPTDALARAVAIGRLPHGTPKSIAEMVLNFMVVIEDMDKRIKELEGK
jgi:hypothetical protein